MQFLKKNIWTICSLVLLMLVAVSGDAAAASTNTSSSTDLMGIATNKATNVFKAVKTVVFVIGGFGLVAIAFFAIFGKLKWTWFAGLAVGLGVLAAAGYVIEYATGESNMAGSGGSMGDTFKQSGDK